MQRSDDRILTTHVGSLVRPTTVAEGLYAQTVGEPYDEAAFEEALTPAVAEVVAKQAELGIDIPSDGEFGKTMWTGYGRMGGIEETGESMIFKSAEFAAFGEFYAVEFAHEASSWRSAELVEKIGNDPVLTPQQMCTGPLTYEGSHAIDRDIANIKAAMAAAGVEEGFLPLAAPASMEGMIINKHYETDEEFVFALADALRPDYQAVVDSGLVLQVDDAFLPSAYDGFQLEGKSMEEYLKYARIRIDAVNHALRGIPEDRVRYHICWGSWQGPHVHDVELRDIIDLLLEIKAQTYSIEAANPRHEWEWQVWQDVKLPEGKILAPGVVTHSTHVVEHPETVAERIIRFADLIGKENLIASTDCGFAQGWMAARTHPTVQWAKLKTLAEGAELASQRLYR